MITHDLLLLAFLFIAGHALADYPLQGEVLALGKSRFKPSPFVPWWQALSAHALIHGGIVAILTGFWWLGLAEAVAHGVIDDMKCAGRIGFNTDQALHLTCKALWLLIVWRLTT